MVFAVVILLIHLFVYHISELCQNSITSLNFFYHLQSNHSSFLTQNRNKILTGLALQQQQQ